MLIATGCLTFHIHFDICSTIADLYHLQPFLCWNLSVLSLSPWKIIYAVKVTLGNNCWESAILYPHYKFLKILHSLLQYFSLWSIALLEYLNFYICFSKSMQKVYAWVHTWSRPSVHGMSIKTLKWNYLSMAYWKTNN